MNVTRSPTATTSCRGSAPVAAIRMIGGSAGGGGVGPVGGPGGAPPDEPPPQVDASAARAIVTNEERIFRRR